MTKGGTQRLFVTVLLHHRLRIYDGFTPIRKVCGALGGSVPNVFGIRGLN